MLGTPKLYFSPGSDNAKLKKLEAKYGKVYTFSTMSGYNCPYAKDCHSKAVFNGKGWNIVDGKFTKFRCFSASQEVIFRAVREQRLANMAINTLAALPLGYVQAALAIHQQLPNDAKVVRINVGGDFSTQAIFDAWLYAACYRPSVKFYAYTKSLPFWVKRLDLIPANLQLTASYGGWKDDLIARHNLRSAKVVFSTQEALDLGLEIDYDDSLALHSGPSFALLLHGIQPKGTEAAEALKKLKTAKKELVA